MPNADLYPRLVALFLTASTNMLLPRLSDSLAGRMEILRLHPLAQCELARAPSSFLDALFNGGFGTGHWLRRADSALVGSERKPEPRRDAVDDYHRRWRPDGTWVRIHETLRARLRRKLRAC